MITTRAVLVPVDPTEPVGLLGARAWDALRAADGVIVTTSDAAWERALTEQHAPVVALGEAPSTEAVLGALRGILAVGQGAWLCDRAHLAGARELLRAALPSAGAHEEDVTVLQTAPTRKGAALLEAVEIMDRLRADGGDAWSAGQTHATLARYLLEETHETLEVIEDPAAHPPRALADELGDLLFQLVFHARVAEDAVPERRFDIDDVARALNTKMERRNPHVFGPRHSESDGERLEDVEAIIRQWHAVKAVESPEKGLFDGIPRELPALQRAAKIVHRARAAGNLDSLRDRAGDIAADLEEGALALGLLDLVIAAEARDVDPESVVRSLLTRLARDPARPYPPAPPG
ncbi:MAG: MazG nucleotide pyrophosphohydrolase domain-containing protein [Brachybacterium sp.]|nr:MazG nucleotide pyrophosphohydrolase domain-containing protein [Brachybacterium sp.]